MEFSNHEDRLHDITELSFRCRRHSYTRYIESNGSMCHGELSTETQVFSVTWKITDFLNYSHKVDRCFTSPSFQYKGRQWHLRAFPNGQSNIESIGYVDLELVNDYPCFPELLLDYYLGIKKSDGSLYGALCPEENSNYNRVIFRVDRLFERSKFFTRRHSLVPDGAVTFFCRFEEKNVEHSTLDMHTESPEGFSQLVKDFKDLLSSGEDSDITIEIKKREFKVHKSILRARSSVFSAMLRHNMKEKNSKKIDIPDCEPEAFLHYLTYLYTGCVEDLTNDVVFDLYYIADKYDAPEIKVECIDFMINNISIHIFCDIITFCLQHRNETDLLQSARKFFGQNTMDIIVTPEWCNFLKEYPLEANDLHVKALQEEKKYPEVITI